MKNRLIGVKPFWATGRHGFFPRLDKDGDNRVSGKEFDGPADQFDVLDHNKDRYLSEDEHPTAQPPGARRLY